jgi:hypothetical protein
MNIGNGSLRGPASLAHLTSIAKLRRVSRIENLGSKQGSAGWGFYIDLNYL